MPNEYRLHQNFLGGRLTYALPSASTVITDGVSNGTTTITSATAAFTAADVGSTITGTDMPANAYIAAYVSATQVTLSAAATGSGSGRTWTINRHLTMHSAALAAMSVVNTTQHMILTLDEDGMAGEPEIVMVTKHDSAATWAQILRAQETTTTRAHVIGMDWVHGPIAGQVGLIQSGTGSPEGVVTAPVGTIYLRSDGGASTTLYVKQSGTGNTGWGAK